MKTLSTDRLTDWLILMRAAASNWEYNWWWNEMKSLLSSWTDHRNVLRAKLPSMLSCPLVVLNYFISHAFVEFSTWPLVMLPLSAVEHFGTNLVFGENFVFCLLLLQWNTKHSYFRWYNLQEEFKKGNLFKKPINISAKHCSLNAFTCEGSSHIENWHTW